MSATNLKELGVSIIQTISEIEKLIQVPAFSDQLRFFQERYEDEEFRIAVVGEYSTGKSTFLNALIGSDVLSHASKETTAVNTRIVNVPADDPRCGTGQVTFSNQPPLILDNIRDLKQYTTTYSSFYNVASEVESVEIYCSIHGIDSNIVFVDTPGLNGTAEGHYERTAELVKQAHACIYLLQISGLKETDKTFLRILSQYQKHFIIVLNRIDELKQSEGDDLNQIIATQERILREKVFLNDSNVHFEICGISALQALAYADHTINRVFANSSFVLTEESRTELLPLSNFEVFRSILGQTLQAENKLRIKYLDTTVALLTWVKTLHDSITPRLNYYQEEFNSSREGRAIHRLEERKNTLLLKADERKQNLRDHILASCLKYQKDEDKLLHNDLQLLNERYADKINAFSDVKSLEIWSKELPHHIRSGIDPIVLIHRQRLQWRQQELYQRLIQKIEEYTDLNHYTIMIDEQTFITPESPLSLLRLADEFEKEKNIVDVAKQKLYAAEHAEHDAQKNQTDMLSNLHELESNRNLIENLHQIRLVQLGARPAPITKTVNSERVVYRGGLGIMDFLFGPKIECYKERIKDDSLGKKWDNQKRTLTNNYDKEMASLSRELSRAQREYDNAKREYNRATEKTHKLQADLQEKEAFFRKKKELYEHAKRVATEEYLTQCKQSLCSQIRTYLLGSDEAKKSDAGVLMQLKQKMSALFETSKPKFENIAIEYYEKALQQKLTEIDQAIQHNTPYLQSQLMSLKNADSQLGQMIMRMEDYLNAKSI